ncbi:MAG: hypothetical protein A2Y33_16105 [Spirochaetes bacterium GWF1_51_8]|uniref:UPF0251 protein UW07_C0010G0001 n=1 Tax=Candidatus Nomurabacteria bacterium GW2011_GWF2_43_8 TaxID=1618779 RepID=A0A0G1INA1_9BACT|nr:MAG: hypothetical protein UW07_C0010G0001 [Candidatus Nomurabacteria bacterium GW2011_GWF2_43_8]OHD54893.1 MAG: hypothetical protein A2Y33_16105 [Spirochaetes bacterium GWF1_51_8]
MPRPFKCRRMEAQPVYRHFFPPDTDERNVETVVLTLDEWEAVRLADWAGYYQEDAAARMEVSRQTFGNIITSARRKIADCLINGKPLSVDGGAVEVAGRHICPKHAGTERPFCGCGKRKRYMEKMNQEDIHDSSNSGGEG